MILAVGTKTPRLLNKSRREAEVGDHFRLLRFETEETWSDKTEIPEVHSPRLGF
jgi:hypothetical protein